MRGNSKNTNVMLKYCLVFIFIFIFAAICLTIKHDLLFSNQPDTVLNPFSTDWLTERS